MVVYTFSRQRAYGRVVYLEPVTWKNGFPVIGVDADGDGTGEPVLRFKKPNVGKTFPIETPADSDEFDGNSVGPQWQWHANTDGVWALPDPERGALRLFSVELPENYTNLWDLPNLLLQKFPADEFTATTKVTLNPRFEGEKFGFVVMGLDYSYVGLTYKGTKLYIAAGDSEGC